MLLVCLILLSSGIVSAQQQSRISKGSKVFVTTSAKNENAIKAVQEVNSILNEWGYWKVVDRKEEAEFMLDVEVTATKGITITSWGGTSYLLVARILDKKKDVLWESNGYKSSPNGTNGFNAGKSVAKKLLRDLKKYTSD